MYDTPFSSLEYLPSPWQDVDEQTRSLLDQALKIYSGRKHFRPENARALYKKGKLLERIGTDAQEHLKWALNMYQGLAGNPNLLQGLDEVTDADFDRLIVFWSK